MWTSLGDRTTVITNTKVKSDVLTSVPLDDDAIDWQKLGFLKDFNINVTVVSGLI